MENKRYYWIKLKTNFFERDDIDFILSQKNGCQYIVLYQMLCMKSVNNDGILGTKIDEMIIPYNVEKIIRDTKYFDFDTVSMALGLFKQLGLIYEEENGILKIMEYDDLVGSETASTIRSRKCRENQKMLQCNNNATIMQQQCNVDIDIDKDIDIDIDKEKDIYIEKEKKKDINNTLYDLIENNFNRTLNSIEYEYISKWKDNELTRYVIKETIAKNICNVKYIDTTLNNYKSRNITTVQQAQEEEQLFQKKKNEYNQKKYFNANERASMSLDEFVRRGEEEENKTKEKGK